MVKIGKIIGFNILIVVTIANLFHNYFNNGSFTPMYMGFGWLEAVWMGLLLILLVWLLGFMVNMSFVITRAVKKKNLLRIPFFTFLIISLVSFVYLIRGWWIYGITYSLLSLTILFVILTVLNYLMLKDLHKLINQIFTH